MRPDLSNYQESLNQGFIYGLELAQANNQPLDNACLDSIVRMLDSVYDFSFNATISEVQFKLRIESDSAYRRLDDFSINVILNWINCLYFIITKETLLMILGEVFIPEISGAFSWLKHHIFQSDYSTFLDTYFVHTRWLSNDCHRSIVV